MYVTFYVHPDDSTFPSSGEIKPPVYGIVVRCTIPRRLSLQTLVARCRRSMGRCVTHRRLKYQGDTAGSRRPGYLATPPGAWSRPCSTPGIRKAYFSESHTSLVRESTTKTVL